MKRIYILVFIIFVPLYAGLSEYEKGYKIAFDNNDSELVKETALLLNEYKNTKDVNKKISAKAKFKLNFQLTCITPAKFISNTNEFYKGYIDGCKALILKKSEIK